MDRRVLVSALAIVVAGYVVLAAQTAPPTSHDTSANRRHQARLDPLNSGNERSVPADRDSALDDRPDSSVGSGSAVALAVTSDNFASLRSWDDRINSLARSRDLVLRTSRFDTLLPNRVHERYDQYVNGVRVFGADIARGSLQGTSESVFGTVYGGIGIATVPSLSEDMAHQRFAALSDAEVSDDHNLELVIVPKDNGGYALHGTA